MTKQMEFYRDLSITQVQTISDLSGAFKEYKEAAKTTAKAVKTVQEIAESPSGGKDASPVS